MLNDLQKVRILVRSAELRKNGDVVIKSPIHYGSEDGKEILSITADECMKSLVKLLKGNSFVEEEK